MQKKIILFVIAVISFIVAAGGIYSYASYADDIKATKEQETKIKAIFEKCVNAESSQEKLVNLSELKNGLNDYKTKRKVKKSVIDSYEKVIKEINDSFIEIYDKELLYYNTDEVKKQTEKEILNRYIQKLTEILDLIKRESEIVEVNVTDYESKILLLNKACEGQIAEIAEKERTEAERIKAERIEAERIEAEKKAAEAEAERIKVETSKNDQNTSSSISGSTTNSTGNLNLQKGMNAEEYSQAYEIAAGIANKYAGKSREEQLKGIYKDLRGISLTVNYSDKDEHYSDIYGFYVLHRSSCAGATRAAGLCLNILGIDYEHVNENKWQHQWCRVKTGDNYWICDPFGMYVGQEPGPYKHPYVK